MGVVRYLLVIALLGVLAILTVAEHVERTRLGYEVRELEREVRKLEERRKSSVMAYERACAPERVIDRAEALHVVGVSELDSLRRGAR